MVDPPPKPVLQKPPGYRHPTVPGKPLPVPPQSRKAVLPTSFRPRRNKQRSFCRACCCCFCVLFVIVTFIVVISGALFFLWFDPKLPSFHLQSFKLSAFNVTAKPEGTVLNAAAAARVEVRNPNGKLKYHYGESEVEITAGENGDADLGSAKVAGFVQGKKNATSLKVKTRVKDLVVGDGLGSRLKKEFRSKDLAVNLEMKTSVGVGVEGMKIGMLGMEIRCRHIKLKQFDNGVMPKCTINTLKWINIH